LVLLASALNLSSTSLRIVGAAAVLQVCALYVSWTFCPYLDPVDPRSWWRAAPPGVALLSTAGAPLTLGFPARAAIYSALFAERRWLVLLLVILGEAAILGALLRVLLDVECVLPDDESTGADIGGAEAFPRAWQREVAYGAAAALALGILVLGARPSLLGDTRLGTWFGLLTAPAWAALLLPVIAAVLLYRVQERITSWMEDWTPMIEQALDMRWAYKGTERIVHVLGSLVWNGSAVIEGAGYMAWVTLVGLVLVLLVVASR
jgi:hypothetical protein